MAARSYLQNTWIEVSESAYAHNVNFFRNLSGPKPELSVVVKANAYGHGWEPISRLAVKHGADSFCVHSLDEALKLREANITQNILVMGPIPPSRLIDAIDANLRIVVFDQESLIKLQKTAAQNKKTARVHLKLETGTHRQGLDQKELKLLLEKLRDMPNILLEAVYTHFANIEDTTNHDYAEYQKYHFNQLVKRVQSSGYPVVKKHAACSAAALLFKDTHLDMIRLGISQYGLWPSAETLISYQAKLGEPVGKVLRPVLSWKTRITQLKWVTAENTIGYGRTYKTTRKTRLGILPVGYSEGYDRGLSNQSYVLVRGKRAPVRGRICMNLMMIDVTDIPDVQLYDEVVLVGKQGEEEITADYLAGLCGTINYEIVTRIDRDIPRLIVE